MLAQNILKIGKPFEEIVQIVRRRFENQLSNPNSIMITITNQNNGDIIGISSAQLMTREHAYQYLGNSMKSYVNSEIPLSYISEGIAHTDNLTHVEESTVFVIEELGIANLYRGTRGLLLLSSTLAYALKNMSPSTQDFFMWTIEDIKDGKMDQLAKAAGMNNLLTISGNHNGNNVTLNGYKFKNDELEFASQDENHFKMFLLAVALKSGFKGDFSRLKTFFNRIFNKKTVRES